MSVGARCEGFGFTQTMWFQSIWMEMVEMVISIHMNILVILDMPAGDICDASDRGVCMCRHAGLRGCFHGPPGPPVPGGEGRRPRGGPGEFHGRTWRQRGPRPELTKSSGGPDCMGLIVNVCIFTMP